MLKQFKKSLRKSQTDAESRLWYQLRNRNFQNHKFRRQPILCGYIVDFVCLEKKLVIELDGGQPAEKNEYDSARTLTLEADGFQVLRFWNNEIFNNMDGVLETIDKELNTPHPLHYAQRPLPQGGEVKQVYQVNELTCYEISMPPERIKLQLPYNADKLLLHSCCAPCAGEIMEALRFSEIDFTIFFYNPNIHPRKEYELRKEENKRYAHQYSIPYIDLDNTEEDDYEIGRAEWFKRAKGMEFEPERGIRCTMCFDMRFVRTAQYAFENEFPLFATSLGISRWKNLEQINQAGLRAANLYEGVNYWDYNWRKGGGSQRMIEISKQERFYQQEYCGCAYSRRDTDKWRVANGREKIKIGQKFYGDEKLNTPHPLRYAQRPLPQGKR